jgi:hypothetical protein
MTMNSNILEPKVPVQVKNELSDFDLVCVVAGGRGNGNGGGRGTGGGRGKGKGGGRPGSERRR